MRIPISYYGGKQTMLKHILPLIPSHKIYTEAFCGGAAVLFAKRPSEAEIINDINMELTNFYWCMQVYYSDLKHEINKTLHSRDLQPMPDISTLIRSSLLPSNGHGPYGCSVKCRLRQ